MSEEWTLARIERLVADSASESPTLEFKRADALDLRNEKNKRELAKDITGMANAAGGTIIYGMAEAAGRHGVPVASGYDCVSTTAVLAESLENVLTSWVQPAIPDIQIAFVPKDDEGFWVIQVPESLTAHQVLGTGTYYRRWNFKSEPMPDYMVREVMNRGNKPRLEVEVGESAHQDGLFLDFAVRNAGRAATRGWALQVSRTESDDLFEIHHVGLQAADVRLEYQPDPMPGAGAARQRIQATAQLESSLFPGQSRDLSRAFRVLFRDKPGIETLTVEERSLHWAVFCDGQPAKQGRWDPQVFLARPLTVWRVDRPAE